MPVVISQLTIDSADPATQARWWADVLGWRLVGEPGPQDEEVEISPSGQWEPACWLFLRVGEGKTVKNRLHVDLRPADGSSQGDEVARLLATGARLVDIGQGDVPWRVLADPEGNEFCVLRNTPSALRELLRAQV